MTSPTASAPGLPDYAPVPRASLGPAVNDQGYYVGHVRADYRAQCRTFGGGQAAPDAVLADVPVPKRERQARGADRAGCADGNRRRLLPGLLDLHALREPLFGIMAAVSAAGMPDDAGPQGLINDRPGQRQMRRPGSCPLRGAGSRRGILRRGARGTAIGSVLPGHRSSGKRRCQPSSHAVLAPGRVPVLPSRPIGIHGTRTPQTAAPWGYPAPRVRQGRTGPIRHQHRSE